MRIWGENLGEVKRGKGNFILSRGTSHFQSFFPPREALAGKINLTHGHSLIIKKTKTSEVISQFSALLQVWSYWLLQYFFPNQNHPKILHQLFPQPGHSRSLTSFKYFSKYCLKKPPRPPYSKDNFLLALLNPLTYVTFLQHPSHSIILLIDYVYWSFPGSHPSSPPSPEDSDGRDHRYCPTAGKLPIPCYMFHK